MANEKRLIDAKHAIKLLREIRNDYPADSVRHKMLNMVISILANPQQIPTVDAVEVVRCKDCLKRDTVLCPMETYDDFPWRASRGDDFCSYGERKDNGI